MTADELRNVEPGTYLHFGGEAYYEVLEVVPMANDFKVRLEGDAGETYCTSKDAASAEVYSPPKVTVPEGKSE